MKNFLAGLYCALLCYIACIDCKVSQVREESDDFDADGEDTAGDENEIQIPYCPIDEIVKNYQSKEFIQFDLALLQVLSKQNVNKNIVVSPASIKALLALLTRVYAKDKVDEISRVWGDAHGSIELLGQLQTLLQNNQTSITIESRNKIYQANDSQSMLDETAMENSTEIETLDFSNPRAADIINNWVKESTRGLIPSIVEKDQISEATKRVLLNCIYLKARWETSFSSSETQNGCFYSSPGDCSQVKFMYSKRGLKFAELPEYKSIMFELSFSDPRYAIVFVVPEKDTNVYDVLTRLKSRNLFKLFDRMSEETVKLSLPRTTIEFTDSTLINTLKKPQIKSFFGMNVKLDSMLHNDVLLSVDSLMHRAKIILNEEGAEAAAVSGGLEFRSFIEERVVRVDRPFLFFLHDKNTGFILFEGIVNSPDSAK